MTQSRSQLAEDAVVALAQLRGEVASGSIPASYAVILATTTVEAYVDGALQVLVDSTRVAESRFGAWLLAQKGDRLHDTWPSRYELFKDAFGISFTTKEKAPVQALIDLRNALAHGVGSLTPRQRATPSKMVLLESQLRNELGVVIDGASLHVGEATAARAVEVGMEFVHVTEGKVRALYGAIRF